MASEYETMNVGNDDLHNIANTPADANPSEKVTDEQVMQSPDYMADANSRQVQEAKDITDIQASSGQASAGGVAVGEFGNVAGRMAADERADAERRAALPAQMKESAAKMAPPTIPQPQAPTTQINSDGFTSTIGERQTSATPAPRAANPVYDNNGNIVGWKDAVGNAIAAPKSMQMMAAVSGPGKGESANNRFGVTQEQLNAVEKEIAAARLSDQDRRRKVAQYNQKVGNSFGAALWNAAANNRIVEMDNVVDGYTYKGKYLMGIVNRQLINEMNKELQGLGRHTVASIASYQEVNAQGKPGEPFFIIRYNKDGSKTAAGETYERVLTKEEVENAMKTSFANRSSGKFGDKYIAERDYEDWHKATFKDHYGEMKAEQQKDEDRLRAIRADENKMYSSLISAMGDSKSMTKQEFMAKVYSSPDLVKWFSQGEPYMEKLKSGEEVPMLDDKKNIMYKKLTPEQTKARIEEAAKMVEGGMDPREAYKKATYEKMAENAGVETDAMRLRREKEQIAARRQELMRMKEARGMAGPTVYNAQAQNQTAGNVTDLSSPGAYTQPTLQVAPELQTPQWNPQGGNVVPQPNGYLSTEAQKTRSEAIDAVIRRANDTWDDDINDITKEDVSTWITTYVTGMAKRSEDGGWDGSPYFELLNKKAANISDAEFENIRQRIIDAKNGKTGAAPATNKPMEFEREEDSFNYGA